MWNVLPVVGPNRGIWIHLSKVLALLSFKDVSPIRRERGECVSWYANLRRVIRYVGLQRRVGFVNGFASLRELEGKIMCMCW